MQINDKISFGNFGWRVLDIQNNRILIITENIIETRSYHDRYVDITWAECTLRKYLNDEFYDSFSTNEKSRIIPVINTNLDNQWYGTNGGCDTQDSIFLLSLEEAVCKYFGDSSAKLHKRNERHKYWFQRKDENNSKRVAASISPANYYKRPYNSYWLRSPGRISKKAVYIKGTGCVGIQGNNVLENNISESDYFGGVRPALWLRTENS